MTSPSTGQKKCTFEVVGKIIVYCLKEISPIICRQMTGIYYFSEAFFVCLLSQLELGSQQPIVTDLCQPHTR